MTTLWIGADSHNGERFFLPSASADGLYHAIHSWALAKKQYFWLKPFFFCLFSYPTAEADGKREEDSGKAAQNCLFIFSFWSCRAKRSEVETSLDRGFVLYEFHDCEKLKCTHPQ